MPMGVKRALVKKECVVERGELRDECNHAAAEKQSQSQRAFVTQL